LKWVRLPPPRDEDLPAEIEELEEEAEACRQLMAKIDKAGAKDLAEYAQALEATAAELRRTLAANEEAARFSDTRRAS
jgi:hypothetical protein